MSFQSIYEQLSWNQVSGKILSKTRSDVTRALHSGSRDMDDLAALLSPAAEHFLEEMAGLSHEITKKRFGKCIQMYIPLYLSNSCNNSCLYCGFRRENQISRTVLTHKQISEEIKIIKSYGFDHVLLVTGENSRLAGPNFLKEALALLRPHFSHISMEVQPLETEDYLELTKLGLNTVLVYQETYHKESYAEFHPKGKKSDFFHRLLTPDRLGKADIHKIGLGCLLGLEDWRVDAWMVGRHLSYLEKQYWKTKFTISFPRLRPARGVIEPKYPVTDRQLLQIICAYRIFNENVELSLSTRESNNFRDHVIRLGITSLSAGSKTEPGGYSENQPGLKQFEIDDDRTPQEVAAMIQAQGYESVWKDWDRNFG